MTYIDRLNDFNRWLESNALEPVSQLMYFKLLNVFNRAGWPDSVQVDNPRLMSMTGCTSEKSARAARDRLISAGLITYQRGKKGIPGRYALTAIRRQAQEYTADSYPDSLPNEGQKIPGKKYPVNFTGNMGSNQGSNRDVITPGITPPYKDEEQDVEQDMSPNQVYLNREVLSPTESNTTPLYPPTGGACESVPVSEPEKPKKQSKPKKPKEPKVSYAEFVTMTEAEHQKLIDKYGEAKTARMIEILNNYKGSTGKTYASDYMTCLNWVAERAEQQLQRNAYQNNAYQGGGYGQGGEYYANPNGTCFDSGSNAFYGASGSNAGSGTQPPERRWPDFTNW